MKRLLLLTFLLIGCGSQNEKSQTYGINEPIQTNCEKILESCPNIQYQHQCDICKENRK